MKKNVVTTFLVMGPGTSVFMFALHALFSKYSMHPLAFIMCSAPTVLAAPLLALDDEDF